MRPHTFTLCALTPLALLGTSSAAQPQLERVDAYVRQELERQRVPGAAIAIVQDGKLVHARGFGLANVELGVTVSPATVFQSASVGKQFTATLVMMLVEEGRIGLDDPVRKYIPEASESWDGITIRQMLSHTSGISNRLYDSLDMRRDHTEEDLTRLITALPLDFPPGTKWNYSNPAYVMLGVVIRRVTGKFYGDGLRERIFTPLGMTTARVISEADIVPNRSAGYRLADGDLKNQSWVSPVINTTADGSLYFTVLDLAKWDAALATAQLLPRGRLEEMWTPVRLQDGTTQPYGLGWSLASLGDQRIVEHGGSWQGFRSYIVRYLGARTTVVVLANAAQADPGLIAKGVAAIYDPTLAAPTPPR